MTETDVPVEPRDPSLGIPKPKTARAKARVRRAWAFRILTVGALAVVAAVAVRGWLPEPERVVLGSVRRAPLRITVEERGRTRLRDRFTVAAPVTGELERIELEVGTWLGNDCIIARIRPIASPLQDRRTRTEALARLEAALATMRQAAADERRARATLELASRERSRAEALRRANAIGPAEFDATVTRERESRAGVDAAAMAVAAARAMADAVRALLAPEPRLQPGNRASVLVRAPAAGRILAVHQRGPGVVTFGAPLVELGDPTRIEIVVGLLTRDAIRVATYGEAIVHGWGGGPFRARLRRIDPAGYTRLSALGVEEQRVDAILDIADESFDRSVLGDGFRVEVSLTAFAAPDALIAPSSALFRSTEGWAAYVVEEGRARRRSVRIGERSDRDVEVLGGLEPHAQLILHPSDRIAEGTRVREEATDR